MASKRKSAATLISKSRKVLDEGVLTSSTAKSLTSLLLDASSEYLERKQRLSDSEKAAQVILDSLLFAASWVPVTALPARLLRLGKGIATAASFTKREMALLAQIRKARATKGFSSSITKDATLHLTMKAISGLTARSKGVFESTMAAKRIHNILERHFNEPTSEGANLNMDFKADEKRVLISNLAAEYAIAGAQDALLPATIKFITGIDANQTLKFIADLAELDQSLVLRSRDFQLLLALLPVVAALDVEGNYLIGRDQHAQSDLFQIAPLSNPVTPSLGNRTYIPVGLLKLEGKNAVIASKKPDPWAKYKHVFAATNRDNNKTSADDD